MPSRRRSSPPCARLRAARRPSGPGSVRLSGGASRASASRTMRGGDARRSPRAMSGSRTSPATTSRRLEIQRILIDEVLRLEEPFRSTVLLRFFDGLTVAAIARRHGVDESTARWRLETALERLRSALSRRKGRQRVLAGRARAPPRSPRSARERRRGGRRLRERRRASPGSIERART